MASAIGANAFVRILFPTTIAAAGYGATHPATREWLRSLATGPGKYYRVLALLFFLVNWKSLPFAWTIRVWRAMIHHLFLHPRPPQSLPHSTLFHHAVSTSYVSPMETDYNLHKSNSTYFADLDVSRTHLVSFLMGPGLKAVAANKSLHNPSGAAGGEGKQGKENGSHNWGGTGTHGGNLVMDPTTNKPAKGKLNVMLGSVHASFKREIPPLKPFEMWSRVLSWDRKWLYIVTHFVEPTKPTSWHHTRYPAGLGRLFGGNGPTRKPRIVSEDEMGGKGWEKKVFATCVSKYVFKIGRLTVNPGVVVGESGLLPNGRPGGWVGGETGTGVEVELNGDVVFPKSVGMMVAAGAEGEEVEVETVGEWTWRHTEKMRMKGMEFAGQFGALDELHMDWDGGERGALGHFYIG